MYTLRQMGRAALWPTSMWMPVMGRKIAATMAILIFAAMVTPVSLVFLFVHPVGEIAAYNERMYTLHGVECNYDHAENRSLGFVETEGGVPLANNTQKAQVLESTHIFLRCPRLGPRAIYDLCDLARDAAPSHSPYCRVIPALFPESRRLLKSWRGNHAPALFWCREPHIDLSNVQLEVAGEQPCTWTATEPAYIQDKRPSQFISLLTVSLPGFFAVVIGTQYLTLLYYKWRPIYAMDKNVVD